MGPVEKIPFIHEEFKKYVFPITLAVVIILTIFNVADYVKYKCSRSQQSYLFEEQDAREKILDGEFIIDKIRENK